MIVVVVIFLVVGAAVSSDRSHHATPHVPPARPHRWQLRRTMPPSSLLRRPCATRSHRRPPSCGAGGRWTASGLAGCTRSRCRRTRRSRCWRRTRRSSRWAVEPATGRPCCASVASRSDAAPLSAPRQSPHNLLTISLQSPYNLLTISLQSPYNLLFPTSTVAPYERLRQQPRPNHRVLPSTVASHGGSHGGLRLGYQSPQPSPHPPPALAFLSSRR